MVVVIGFLAAAAVAIAVAWIIAGRGSAVERRQVTGMVLIVTLGRNLPDPSGLTTVLTMFFVAYSGRGLGRLLARYAPFAIRAYAQGAVVLVAFLLLCVLGLA